MTYHVYPESKCRSTQIKIMNVEAAIHCFQQTFHNHQIIFPRAAPFYLRSGKYKRKMVSNVHLQQQQQSN